MYSSPLAGFPMTWYRFRTGTLKEPFLACLGDTRGALDICVSVANALVPLALVATSPESPVICLWAACVLALLISDFSGYIGALGCWYGPLSGVFAFRAIYGDRGHLAALQIILLLVYFGCGVGKLGPWFPYVMAEESTQPIFCPARARGVFYKNFGERNFAPSSLAKASGYLAAAFEAFFPLLFLFGSSQQGRWLVVAPLVGLTTMHLYIMGRLSSDVFMLLGTILALMECMTHLRSEDS